MPQGYRQGTHHCIPWAAALHFTPLCDCFGYFPRWFPVSPPPAVPPPSPILHPPHHRATREYSSYKTTAGKTTYTFSIELGDAPSTLRFCVAAADDVGGARCSGPTPAAAWKAAKERLEAAGVPVKSKKAAAWWFGLKEPGVAVALQGMPGIPGSAFVLKETGIAATGKHTSKATAAVTPVAPMPFPEIIHTGTVDIILDDPSQDTVAVTAAAAPESTLCTATAALSTAAGELQVDADGDVDLVAGAPQLECDPAATGAVEAETDAPEDVTKSSTSEHPAQSEHASGEQQAAEQTTGSAAAGEAAAAAFAANPVTTAPDAPTSSVLASAPNAAAPAAVVEWFIPTPLMPACISAIHGQHATKKDLAHACAAACPGATLKSLRSTISSVTMQITDKALGLKRAWCVRQSVLDALAVKLAPDAVPAVADPGVTARAAAGVDEAAAAVMQAAATAAAAAAAKPAAAAAPAEPVAADPRLEQYMEQLRAKYEQFKSEHGLGVAVADGSHATPLRRNVPGSPEADVSVLANAVLDSGDDDALKRKVALDAFVAIVGHGSPCDSAKITAAAMHALLQEHSAEGSSAVPAQSDIQAVLITALTWRSASGVAGAAPGVVPSATPPVHIAAGYWDAPAVLLKVASKDLPREQYEDVRDCGEALRTGLSTLRALLRLCALLGGTPDKVASAEGNGKLSTAQADLLRKQEAEAAKAAQREERLAKRATAAEAAAVKEAEAAARKAAAADERVAKKLKKAGVSSAQQKIMASFFGGAPAAAAAGSPAPKVRIASAAAAEHGTTPSKHTPTELQSIVSPVHRALVRVAESEGAAARRAATTARLDAAYLQVSTMDEPAMCSVHAQLLADLISSGKASRAAACSAAGARRQRRLRSQLRAVVVDAPIGDLMRPPPNTAAVPQAGGGEADSAVPAWAGGKVLKHVLGAGAIQLPGEEQRLLVPAHFGRAKLLYFTEDRRPPYWGTWSKGGVGGGMPPLKGPDAMPATLQDGSAAWYIQPRDSVQVGALGGRRPLLCDTRLFDYMVDSEAEWESEDEEGEDLASDDEEEEEEEEALAPQGTAAGYDYEDGFMALDTVVHYAGGAQEDEEGDTVLQGGGSPAQNPVRGGTKRSREGGDGDAGKPPKCARVLTGLAASIAQSSGTVGGVGGATGKRVLKFGVVHDVASHAQAGNDAAGKLAPMLRPMAGSLTSFVRPARCLQYSQIGHGTTAALPRFSLPSFEPVRVFGKVKARKAASGRVKGVSTPVAGRGQTHFPTEDAAVSSLKAVMRDNNRPYEKVADLWVAQHGPQWPGTTCASVRRAVLQLGTRDKGQNKPWHLHGEPAPGLPAKAAAPAKPAKPAKPTEAAGAASSPAKPALAPAE